MKSIVVIADALLDGSKMISRPAVVVEDGRIASVSSRVEAELPRDAEISDFPGATLASASLDVHIHGAAGHDVMDASPKFPAAMGRFLASRGTGAYLATTVTAPLDRTLKAVSALAKVIAEGPVAGQARPIEIISKDRFFPTPSEACSPRNTCWSRILPSSIACVRLPKVR